MSDISFDIEWWALLLYSPVLGWPGLLIGATIGGLLWRRRRILAAILGAIAGNLLWFAAVMLKF